MYTKALVICLLIGASFAREDEDKDMLDSSETVNSKREAAISSNYGPPSQSSGDKEPAPVYGPPSHSSHSSPASYSKSIPAAAIRNVETVAITKTITPVITKTTHYNTHSEPALSIGHVQGYSHSAKGEPKIAPVQFQTQYTSYHNPTVGVNGPVTYTGPAMVLNGGYAIPLTGLSNFATAHNGGHGFTLSSGEGGSSSNGDGSPAPVYGPPSESSSDSDSGAPASTYGPPGQSAGRPLGQYSMSVPQYVSLRPSASVASAPQHALSLHNIQQLQRLRAPAPFHQQFAAPSSISPVAFRPAQQQLQQQQYSSQYVMLNGRPISLSSLGLQASPSSSGLRYLQPQQSSSIPSGLRYLQPQQSSSIPSGLRYLQASPSSSIPTGLRYISPQQLQFHQPQSIYQQRRASQPSSHQQLAQPSVRQYIQTYAMPSISFTRLQPAGSQQSPYQSHLTRAIRH